MKYSYGPYNKFDDKEQWIRITEGCPNHCPYCYEPQEFKVFGTPEIVRNEVKIMDMNLLCKPQALGILYNLPRRLNKKVIHYDLICGIDWRFLTEDIAIVLKDARFQKIRLAWDYGFQHQVQVKNAVKLLRKVGYKNPRDIMVFMVCNWKTPYETNLAKLELLKVWGCQVSDCWFDNQVSPNIKPIHWTEEQIKDFRKRCRHHNHLVSFGLDPLQLGWSILDD